MLACCAIGALFIIQLMAFSRWFSRVILRKPPEEDEEDYWLPERVSIKDRLTSFLSNRRRLKILSIAVTVQITLCVATYIFGGFAIIEMGYAAIVQDTPTTFKHNH